jgi:type VI secretion system protein ImpE
MDKKTMSMVQTYGAALQCEAIRAEVFAGKRSPLGLRQAGGVGGAVARGAQADGGGQARRSRFAARAGVRGGPHDVGIDRRKPFTWIADADSRLGPMLEAIVNGRYYWLPFQRLKEIRVEAPADLRDFVWAPAYLTLANGGETVALIPTRYPARRRARTAPSGWRARPLDGAGPDTFMGLGQRC